MCSAPRIRAAVIISSLIVSAAMAQPANAPTTEPAELTLDGGRLVFTPPPALSFLGKRDDDRSAGFSYQDNRGLVTLAVTPQEQAIPDDLAPQLARLLTKTIREEAGRGQLDIVMPPRAERAPGLLLRLHDKFNTDERFGDRVQLYRGVGLYLVCVVATAFTEDETEAARLHEIGTELLLSVRVNRGGAGKPAAPARVPPARPMSFPNAGIRATPPEGWAAEGSDNASGIIVTYRDPDDATNLIAVSVRSLPPEARRDTKLREILVDEIVSGEKQSFKIEGAEVAGDTRVISDRRFLKKTRTDYDHEGKRFAITSRQIRAGEVIVSVTMVALEDRVEEIDALADRVAIGVRPLVTRPP